MKLPQLHLRDLFWLVALVGMGCGWWVDRQQTSRTMIKVERFRNLEATADRMAYFIEKNGLGRVSYGQFGASIDNVPLPQADWESRPKN